MTSRRQVRWLALGASAIAVIVVVGLALRTVPNQAAATPDEPSVGRATTAAEDEPLVRESSVASVESRVPAPRVAPLPSNTCRVIVVDAATDAPIANAIVRWSATQDIPCPEGWDRIDVETALTRGSQTLACDERGEAGVPWNRGQVVIASRRGELFGYVFSRSLEEQPVKLALFRDRALEIQVVDASGGPLADVPVALATTKAEFHPSRWWPMWPGTTSGPRGIARFPHLDVKLSTLEAGWQLGACLAIPTRAVQPVEIRMDALPNEPVRLVAPDCGWLDVAIVDETGHPPKEAHLETRWRASGTEACSHDASFGGFAKEGHVVFLFVETGLQVELKADDLRTHVPVQVVIDGPKSKGERTSVTVKLEERLPTIRGRLVDVGGAPMVKRNVEAIVLTAGDSGDIFQRQWPGETDDAGVFEVPIRSGTRDRIVEAPELIAYDEGRVEIGRARLPLEPQNPTGRIEVGDVVLHEAPILCAGVVVDEGGDPSRGVFVSVQRLVPDASRGASTRSSDPGWHVDRSWSVMSDDRGAFALRTLDAPTRLRVTTSKDGFLSTHLDVDAGAQELRLVLRKAGRISGRVLLDPGIDPSALSIDALPPKTGGDHESHFGGRAKPQGDGRFRIEQLEPGTYGLTVGLEGFQSGFDAPFTSLDTVASGNPPTLEIDLRGKLVPAASLEIVDEAGLPVGDAHVYVQRDSNHHSDLSPKDGRIVLPVAVGPRTIAVTAPGKRPAFLDDVREDHRVVLVAAIRVQITVPSQVRIPGPPLELSAVLVRADAFARRTKVDEAKQWRSKIASIDPAMRARSPVNGLGECSLTVVEAGVYRVEWMLRDTTTNRHAYPALSTDQERTFDVLDRADIQFFVADIDPQKLAKAAEWLAKAARGEK